MFVARFPFVLYHKVLFWYPGFGLLPGGLVWYPWVWSCDPGSGLVTRVFGLVSHGFDE